LEGLLEVIVIVEEILVELLVEVLVEVSLLEHSEMIVIVEEFLVEVLEELLEEILEEFEEQKVEVMVTHELMTKERSFVEEKNEGLYQVLNFQHQEMKFELIEHSFQKTLQHFLEKRCLHSNLDRLWIFVYKIIKFKKKIET
jgi:hypothetical protein